MHSLTAWAWTCGAMILIRHFSCLSTFYLKVLGIFLTYLSNPPYILKVVRFYGSLQVRPCSALNRVSHICSELTSAPSGPNWELQPSEGNTEPLQFDKIKYDNIRQNNALILPQWGNSLFLLQQDSTEQIKKKESRECGSCCNLLLRQTKSSNLEYFTRKHAFFFPFFFIFYWKSESTARGSNFCSIFTTLTLQIDNSAVS